MERQITDTTIQNVTSAALRNSLYHCYPGNIVTYDSTQETASVQIGTNDVRKDVDTGARVSEPFPVIFGVPVAWMRFGGFVIKGSLNPYDPVMLIAIDLDPAPWRAAGRTLRPVDPGDIRRHGGGYWWAIPTDITLKRTPSSPTGTLSIGVEGGQPLIEITAAGINLGASASNFVALSNLVATQLGLISTAFDTVATALSIPNPYAVPGPVAASITKAQ
jgi:hypothetical protein